MKPVNLIAAVSENGGIGIKNDLPWRLKKEMAHFTNMTTKTKDISLRNAVLMGRNTWDSVPPKYKPFANRLNAIITSKELEIPEGVHTFKTVSEGLNALQTKFPDVESIWIIGGTGVYQEALEKKLCDKLYITEVKKNFECDKFFPKFSKNDYNVIEEEGVPSEEQEENGICYEIKIYEKKS